MFYSVDVSIVWILCARERAQMSATPPEASPEYSRGPERQARVFRGSHRGRVGQRGRSAPASTGRSVRGWLLGGGLLGSALLLAAEFTTLFEVRTPIDPAGIRSVGTGSHHSYALIPIAVLAVVLSYAVWVAVSRPALLAIGALGFIALLISLLSDLPDVNASGLITRGAHYVTASSSPGAGMYLETLGATLLIITCVFGFLMIDPPRPRSAR
jgi:hypothetical protein